MVGWSGKLESNSTFWTLRRWKQAQVPDLAVRLRWAGAVSIVMAIILPFVMGEWSALSSLGFAMAFWIFASVVTAVRERLMSTRSSGGALLSRIAGLPRSFLGMSVAHMGVGVFIIGVTMVKTYEVEKDMRMEVGDTVTMGNYTFRFDGVTQIEGPNYTANRGQVLVTKNGSTETVMFPEKRTYRVQTMPMTEAAINTGLFRDLYVSLGEPVDKGAWSVRVYYKPFVDWIWGGCLVMAFGGVLAISDRRYRLVTRKAQEAAVREEGRVLGTNVAMEEQ